MKTSGNTNVTQFGPIRGVKIPVNCSLELRLDV